MRTRSGGAHYRTAALLALAVSLATGAAQAQLLSESGTHPRKPRQIASPFPLLSPHRPVPTTTHSSFGPILVHHRDGTLSLRRGTGFKTTLHDGTGKILSTSTRSAPQAKLPAIPIPVAKPIPTTTPTTPAAATGDTVWVNPRSHIYYLPGSRWYGRTKEGSYMSEQDAIGAGYRAALQH